MTAPELNKEAASACDKHTSDDYLTLITLQSTGTVAVQEELQSLVEPHITKLCMHLPAILLRF